MHDVLIPVEMPKKQYTTNPFLILFKWRDIVRSKDGCARETLIFIYIS